MKETLSPQQKKTIKDESQEEDDVVIDYDDPSTEMKYIKPPIFDVSSEDHEGKPNEHEDHTHHPKASSSN